MNDMDDDTVSEASSNFSGMSAYTTGYTELLPYVLCHAFNKKMLLWQSICLLLHRCPLFLFLLGVRGILDRVSMPT